MRSSSSVHHLSRAERRRRARLAAPAVPERASISSCAWIVGGLFVLALAAYAVALGDAFSADDVFIIQQNPLIRDLWNIPTLFKLDYWAPIATQGLYRPLTMASFAITQAISGGAPGLDHFVNLVLHAAVASTFFLVVRALWPKPASVEHPGGAANVEWPAALAAAWFLLIPLHVEVIAGLVGRSDLMASWFALLVLWLALRWSSPQEPKPALSLLVWLRRALIALLLSAASYFSKESVLVLPVLLPLMLVSVGAQGKSVLARWRSAVVHPAFAGASLSSVIYLALRAHAVGLKPQPPQYYFVNPLAYVDAAARVRTALVIWANGLGSLLWPFRLAPDYSFAQIVPLDSWRNRLLLEPVLALLAVALLAGLAWHCARHDPEGKAAAPEEKQRRMALFRLFLLGLAWTFLVYLPVSNLFFSIGTIRANRLWYFPALGAGLSLAALGELARERFLSRWTPSRRRWLLGGLLALFALFAVVDEVECTYWRDTTTLFTMGVERSPRSARMHAGLGSELETQHDLIGAEGEFRQAFEIDPQLDGAAREIGKILVLEGNKQQGMLWLQRAFDLKPSDMNFMLLADLQVDQHQYQAVIANSRLVPLNAPQARLRLGGALFLAGYTQAAANVLKQVTEEDPSDEHAQALYQRALEKLGQAQPPAPAPAAP